MLTRGIPRAFRDGVHIYRQPPSGQSRVDRITQLRTDDVPCRESAVTGPVVLKVVPVTGAAFSGVTMDQFSCASFFPHPSSVCNGYINSHSTACVIQNVSEAVRYIAWEQLRPTFYSVNNTKNVWCRIFTSPPPSLAARFSLEHPFLHPLFLFFHRAKPYRPRGSWNGRQRFLPDRRHACREIEQRTRGETLTSATAETATMIE